MFSYKKLLEIIDLLKISIIPFIPANHFMNLVYWISFKVLCPNRYYKTYMLHH